MHYVCQVVAPSGQVRTLFEPGDSPARLRERLGKEGYQVVDVRIDLRKTLKEMGRRVEVKRAVLIEFFTYMQGLLSLGLNVSQAINTVRDSIQDATLTTALHRVEGMIDKGYALSAAMEDSKAFPRLVLASVRAAEESNRLEHVFEQLTKHYSDLDELVGSAKKAATYPLIALVVLVAVMTFLLLLVVPQLRDVLPPNPPLPTRILFGLSKLAGFTWWLIPLLPVAATIAYQRMPVAYKLRLSQLMLRVPLVGSLRLNLELATVFSNLAMLNAGGLPILDTFPIVIQATGSRLVASKLQAVYDSVRQGAKLSEAFRDPIFPPLVLRAVAHGEATGRFDKQMEGVGEFLRKRTKTRLLFLATLIEPVLMLVGGGLLLLMALAIFLPIYGQLGQIAR